MKLFQRIERKILKLRSRKIYSRDTVANSDRLCPDKGIVTIYHDYERHYHDECVSRFSDIGVLEMIKIEKMYGVCATYNIVARLIEDVSHIVEKIITNQHEIASHSYSHSIVSKMTKDQIKDDILMTKAVFDLNGLQLNGLRCPQSRWSFKQLPIMARYGMKWSAENDNADFPYNIYKNRSKTVKRMPIKMDDWAYEDSNLSPNQMHHRLMDCADEIAENRIYGAIGFHPWVQGKDIERIKVFEDFIHYLVRKNKISLMTFSQSCHMFSA